MARRSSPLLLQVFSAASSSANSPAIRASSVAACSSWTKTNQHGPNTVTLYVSIINNFLIRSILRLGRTDLQRTSSILTLQIYVTVFTVMSGVTWQVAHHSTWLYLHCLNVYHSKRGLMSSNRSASVNQTKGQTIANERQFSCAAHKWV